jgi:hypothetical protein
MLIPNFSPSHEITGKMAFTNSGSFAVS